jgi:site-specific DNA recombinase
MTRAAIYVRISDDREGLAVGVKRQEADCRALAEQRPGWEVTEVYDDNDISATNRRKVRPAYRRMLDDLREGRVDALVAYSSSRFYRRTRELDELIDLVEDRRVEIATVVSGPIDLTTADGRMHARLQAVIDQGEAERIGERSTRAKADLKAKGGWLGGGGRAYGYERVKDSRGKVTHRIREDEAAVLHELVRRALEGDPLNRLARELNDRGVTTSGGARWNPSRVRATLTSPFHAGQHSDGKPGNWPAIISNDEHRLLRARFPRRTGIGRGHGERPPRAYALSGMLHCSECGKKLLGSGGAYRCMARNGGCGEIRIPAWRVDELVREQVFARAKEPEPRPVTGAPEQDVFLAELRALEVRREDARGAYADGTLSLADWRDLSETIAVRTADLQRQIREHAPRPRMEFAALLEEPAPLDWNEFISEYVERITVSPALRRGRGAGADVPARVEVDWREPS